MPEKRFLSIQELAEYLGVKKNTLYSWVNMRKIPYTKVGRLVRFEKQKIDEWLKKHEVEPHRIWD
ncbi:MAG: helix-turn-helix domain-containing protein [Deltaproteobacteria bacterium]|nr:helix-turn-helix domain-containing protein [Deltaproteobacteria bacterium]